MSLATRVRRIYERHPYPPPNLRGTSWPLPSIEWINTMAERAPAEEFRRILVAGCGVGSEAFALAQRFPGAEVVAVDFSPRSIATAKRLQRKVERGQRVRFEVADIASPDLRSIAGDRFDFISCHGVLSYVAQPLAALRNFVRCLTRRGVLVLGVNGLAHPSVRWRPLLPEFGIDAREFKEGAAVRDVIRVCESLTVYPAIPMADREAGFLAGDLFGPLNRALPLAEWSVLCREAGLHFFGSHHAFYSIRALLNRDLHSVLMPRSRADVSELVDALQPASFHHLVLCRRTPAGTPWADARMLLRQRPILAPLYTVRWPRAGGPWHNLRTLTLESQATGTSVNLHVPHWEVEVLRRSSGEQTLSKILERVTPSVSATSLREAMYLLYLLGVVNLLPESGS